MLGIDYSERLQELTQRISWQIQLPEEMSGFFQESGPMSSMQGDERRAARMRVRTRCLALSEVRLHAFPRPALPEGIYTTDISRHGVGFLSNHQYFPEEIVRLLLPAFWLTARVVRARRLGPKCFQVGARLVQRHDPSDEAFQVAQRTLTEPVTV